MRTTEAATAASVRARKANAAMKKTPKLTPDERRMILAYLRNPDDDPDDAARFCSACGADTIGNDPHAQGCPAEAD